MGLDRRRGKIKSHCIKKSSWQNMCRVAEPINRFDPYILPSDYEPEHAVIQATDGD